MDLNWRLLAEHYKAATECQTAALLVLKDAKRRADEAQALADHYTVIANNLYCSLCHWAALHPEDAELQASFPADDVPDF